MKSTLLTKIAEWACSLQYSDIPADVINLARHQTASVLAACYGAERLPAAGKLRRSLSALYEGPAPAAPFLDRTNPATACGITAGLSVALDFDDYLFLGHTGHSSVSVPLVLGAHLGIDAQEAMAAQVAANEFGGRLGASVVLGPHNGQLWTFIHAGASALAAARLLKLDAEMTAQALALALAAPPYPTFSAMMGPDSKMNLIAEPTAAGVRTAYLAKDGLTGPLEILDEEKGFYKGFAFTPARFYLDGFGKSWVTQSIAYKPYPGCAYVDAIVDSILVILEAFRHAHGRPLAPEEVSEVRIESTLLTVQMEALGREYEVPGELPPVFNLNFRVPHNAALAIIAGRLTSAEFAPEFLAANKEAILRLAAKVKLTHNWEMSIAVARAMSEGLEPFSILAHLPLSGIRKAFRGARDHMSLKLPFSLNSLPSLFAAISMEDFSKVSTKLRKKEGTLADVDFSKLRLPFAARVALQTTTGKSYEAERTFPDGAPGGRDHPQVAAKKFIQEAGVHLGTKGAEITLASILAGAAPKQLINSFKSLA